jgi:hypothetical protein
VALPALRDYKLGPATFTLLQAEVSSRTAEKSALLFVVPRGTVSARLRIAYADDSTEIPLALSAPP